MESIPPRSRQAPEIRYQPSLLSVPSAAATVPPDELSPPSLPASPKGGAKRRLWFFTAVSILLAVGGASLRGSSARISADVRSGSPGYKKSSTGRDLHWANKGITVYLDASLQRLGPTANEAVMQAFGQWVGCDPRLPSLSFDSGKTSTEPKQDGKSTVSYGRITAKGHEHDVAITITYSNDKSGEIVEADIILNALYPMGVLSANPKPTLATPTSGSTGVASGDTASGNANSTHADESMDCQNRYDAQNVATHEAGHFFGLGEDVTERGATMFLSIDQCETHKRVLSSTDVGAVTTLYAANEDPEEAQAGAKGCRIGRAPTSSRAALISSLVLGLGLLRRRSAR